VQLEELYSNDDYNQKLVQLANKNLLPFDDYRQEVFVYMMEHPNTSPKRAAERVAAKMKYWDMKQSTISLDQFGDGAHGEIDAVLWEDRHVLA
jgi:hypothetical protein